jgi:hypothetical protein
MKPSQKEDPPTSSLSQTIGQIINGNYSSRTTTAQAGFSLPPPPELGMSSVPLDRGGIMNPQQLLDVLNAVLELVNEDDFSSSDPRMLRQQHGSLRE